MRGERGTAAGDKESNLAGSLRKRAKRRPPGYAPLRKKQTETAKARLIGGGLFISLRRQKSL